MYVMKWMLVFLVVIIILMMINPTTSLEAFCSNNTMFTDNSAYQTKLNTLFSSLSSNATNNPSGYYRTMVGDPTIDAIYGHYLCRGDLNISSCHDCVTYAINTDLPTGCPNRKVAIIWYDGCMVRYSDVSFFDKWDKSREIISYWNKEPIIGNVTRYMETLLNMMNGIAVRAAEGGPVKKFATGLENFSINQPIYGYVQCTPDLSRDDCLSCLKSSIQSFGEITPGYRVLAPSCVVRYEPNPFFNVSSPPPPSPAIDDTPGFNVSSPPPPSPAIDDTPGFNVSSPPPPSPAIDDTPGGTGSKSNLIAAIGGSIGGVISMVLAYFGAKHYGFTANCSCCIFNRHSK